VCNKKKKNIMDVEGCVHRPQQTLTRRVERVWTEVKGVSQRTWKDVKNSSKRSQRRLIQKMLFIHWTLLIVLVAVFLCMAVSVLVGTGSDSSPYIAGMKFVSIEEERTDIHVRSREVSCEQAQGLEKLHDMDVSAIMETAALLMKKYDMSCNCAPLYNVSYRYMTIQDGWTVIHAFNPVLMGPVLSYGRMLVTESQEQLVPGAGSRNIVRLNGLTLSYMDQVCAVQTKMFVTEIAWCVQSCIELLEGRTIYDVA